MDIDTYAIYIDHEDGTLPPHPGPGWTRFVCISDTHSRRYRVPPGDVLLHAGDLSSWGEFSQLSRTIEWLKSLDHPVKIIVAGNHDGCLDSAFEDSGMDSRLIQQARAYVRSQKAFGLYYLENEPLQFIASTGRMWRVYGTPGSPLYGSGAFQYATREEARALYDRIPHDTEILITHTPPHMMLDETRRGKHAGCEILAARLNAIRNCRLHVFGHIHEATGTHVDTLEGTRLPRVSVNAAIERSESAIVVDLQN